MPFCFTTAIRAQKTEHKLTEKHSLKIAAKNMRAWSLWKKVKQVRQDKMQTVLWLLSTHISHPLPPKNGKATREKLVGQDKASLISGRWGRNTDPSAAQGDAEVLCLPVVDLCPGNDHIGKTLLFQSLMYDMECHLSQFRTAVPCTPLLAEGTEWVPGAVQALLQALRVPFWSPIWNAAPGGLLCGKLTPPQLDPVKM